MFDGTNFDQAQAEAVAILKGYPQGADPSAYTISYSGKTIQVNLNSSQATTLSQVMNINSIPVAVTSSATSPLIPKQVTFTPTQAQGIYWKKVTVRVVRPGSTTEEVVDTVTYQPTTTDNQGQGTMTVSPAGTINLGTYTKLVVQMDVKYNACGIGYFGYLTSTGGSTIYCGQSSSQSDQSYNKTMRSDDPNTVNYLFVDGVQMQQGAPSPLATVLPCNKSTKHAWEDGGGWSRQDIFYTVATVCGTDGNAVRLTN